jgi:hypothetical protein
VPPVDVRPLSTYDPVETALTQNDRLSILALQAGLRQRLGTYTYMEIGSHLGGSLQPFLIDDDCMRIYSIDLRPSHQPDERGVPDRYPGNSTERMLRILRPRYGAQMGKLVCFERDASDVAASELDVRPSFCFIDGEHTDGAAFRDFLSCRRLGTEPLVIAFDDVQLVFRAFARAVETLRKEGTRHLAYVLPDKIAVIEVGELEIARTHAVLERLVMADALIYVASELGRYRDAIKALRRIPGSRLVQRLVAVTPFGEAFKPR